MEGPLVILGNQENRRESKGQMLTGSPRIPLGDRAFARLQSSIPISLTRPSSVADKEQAI